MSCHACRWSRWRMLEKVRDWVDPTTHEILTRHGGLWCAKHDRPAEATCELFEYEPGAAG